MERLSLSHTQVELFEECPRKYQYVYREHLKHEVGIAAKFSSDLIHKPLADLYGKAIVEPNWAALWNTYLGKYGVEAALAGMPYTLDVAKDCFNQYAERFYTTDLTHYYVSSWEEMVFLPLPEDVLYLSKPDVVLIPQQTGRAIPMDFKTSKRPSPMLSSPLNRQLVGQAVAIGANQFIVNVFTLSTTKTGRSNSNLARFEVIIPQDLSMEWKDETLRTARDIRAREATGVWEKRGPKACFNYFQTCQFYDICQAGAARGAMLQEWPKEDRRISSRKEEK